jgi:hypothetical protein
MAGSDVDRTVESRFSMNNAQAMIRGMRIRGGIMVFYKTSIVAAMGPGCITAIPRLVLSPARSPW